MRLRLRALLPFVVTAAVSSAISIAWTAVVIGPMAARAAAFESVEDADQRNIRGEIERLRRDVDALALSVPKRR